MTELWFKKAVGPPIVSSRAVCRRVAKSETGTSLVTGRIATVFRLRLFRPRSGSPGMGAAWASPGRDRFCISSLNLLAMIREIWIVMAGCLTEIALKRVYSYGRGRGRERHGRKGQPVESTSRLISIYSPLAFWLAQNP